MSDRVPRRGSLTVGLDLRYDADVRYHRYDAVEEGDAFASLPAVQDATRDDDYDIENPLATDPGRLEAVRSTGVRLNHDTVTDRRSARAALDGGNRPANTPDAVARGISGC